MAVTTTTTTILSALSPPSFSTLTTTAIGRTKLFHNSPSHTHFPKPTFHALRAKLNNNSAIGEESGGIFDAESFFFGGGEDDRLAENDESDEEEEEEEESESSAELLVKFLQSMVKKISKRAKKASRSVLPSAISTQLVSFAVDGLMILGSLSIVKALLEVACTIGGTVFVSILLLRVIYSVASYFQTSGSNFNQRGSSYGSTQPVS